MAEPIQIQSGMLSWMGLQMPHGMWHFWGVRPTEKHCKA